MPPKTNSGASKKTTEKVKAKVVEDKTFGLKNKKGAKQQKFIQVVQKQVQNIGGQQNPRALDPNAEREKKKEEEKRHAEELKQLFKPVVQAIPKGVDPKSLVCSYFKQGLCQKGDRCKFSHDLAVERKAEKRNIYEDTREHENDGMENWDEAKLEEVINQKHGDDNIKKTLQTQIVCKFFLEAVENKTYGWFWACPNGDKCMYRHALPPGFVLKSEMKKKDGEEEISLEMLVEKERAGLGTAVTRVTLDSFLAWKARKIVEKKEEKKKAEDKKLNDYKKGFMNGITGRDLFTFNPDMVANDDEDADDDIDYKRRADDDDEGEAGATTQKASMRELNSDFFAREAREADGSGTMATSDRFSYLTSSKPAKDDRASNPAQQDDLDENGEEDQTDEDHINSLKKSLTNCAANKTLEIDESLFNLDDLDDIENELDELDIEHN